MLGDERTVFLPDLYVVNYERSGEFVGYLSGCKACCKQYK
mgnify:CR=1 FL=1